MAVRNCSAHLRRARVPGVALMVLVSLFSAACGAGAPPPQAVGPGTRASVRLAGQLDPTFGDGGKLTTDFGSTNEEARGVVVQPDGKILVAGSSFEGDNADFALARYNRDGSLDATFDGDGKVVTPNGSTSDDCFGMALTPDGKALVFSENFRSGTNSLLMLTLDNLQTKRITNPPAGDEFEILTYLDQETYTYRKIVIKDNTLVGAVLVGEVDRAGIFAGLIRDRADITSYKEDLLRPGFGFINLPKEVRSALFAPAGKVTENGQVARAVGH